MCLYGIGQGACQAATQHLFRETEMTPELQADKEALLDEMRAYQRFGGAEDENDPDFDPDFDAESEGAPGPVQRLSEANLEFWEAAAARGGHTLESLRSE